MGKSTITTFTNKGVVKINQSMDFGPSLDTIHVFQYFLRMSKSILDIEMSFYYRMTYDGFIKIATQYEDDTELETIMLLATKNI